MTVEHYTLENYRTLEDYKDQLYCQGFVRCEFCFSGRAVKMCYDCYADGMECMMCKDCAIEHEEEQPNIIEP